MKPFRSAEEMLDAHELMFGEAGRRCAEIVLKWAATLFAVPLETLNIRVVLAPVELGPYNRHTGYHYGRAPPRLPSSGRGRAGGQAVFVLSASE
jgi:hypothetical protein